MISGELINLRAIDRSDLELVHDWLDDPELMRFWGYGAPAVSRNHVMQRIEQWLAEEDALGHPVAFLIETLAGETCGLLVISDIGQVDRNGELSIVLTRQHRGRGFGSDALDTIVDVAFDQWNLHRLTVRSEAFNSDAHRFFTKHGFSLEGRLREARYLDGAWHDVLVFGRLRTDQGETV